MEKSFEFEEKKELREKRRKLMKNTYALCIEDAIRCDATVCEEPEYCESNNQRYILKYLRKDPKIEKVFQEMLALKIIEPAENSLFRWTRKFKRKGEAETNLLNKICYEQCQPASFYCDFARITLNLSNAEYSQAMHSLWQQDLIQIGVRQIISLTEKGWKEMGYPTQRGRPKVPKV